MEILSGVGNDRYCLACTLMVLGEPLIIRGRRINPPPSAPLSVNSRSLSMCGQREAETLGSKFNMLFVGIRYVQGAYFQGQFISVVKNNPFPPVILIICLF